MASSVASLPQGVAPAGAASPVDSIPAVGESPGRPFAAAITFPFWPPLPSWAGWRPTRPSAPALPQPRWDTTNLLPSPAGLAEMAAAGGRPLPVVPEHLCAYGSQEKVIPIDPLVAS